MKGGEYMMVLLFNLALDSEFEFDVTCLFYDVWSFCSIVGNRNDLKS